MGEAAVGFSVPSNGSLDIKGVEWITIKTSNHEKTHYTAILLCCGDGTKLPILLILKQKTNVKFGK